MTVEGIRTRPEESKQELTKFIVSIVLSFLAFAIITMLISVIPLTARSFYSWDTYPEFNYNFFYQWTLRADIDPGEITKYYSRDFLPATGYFIFTKIAFVLFLISNSGALIQNYKRIKQSIFINWGFTLIPIIAMITKLSILSRDVTWRLPDEVVDVATSLALYSLFYLPIQIMLLIEKKTLMQFFGLDIKDQTMEKKERIGRKVNAIFAVIIILSTMLLFLKTLFYTGSNYYDDIANRNVTISLPCVTAVWFITNLFISLKKNYNMDVKGLLGFFTGIIVITLILVLAMFIPDYVILDYFSEPLGNYEFPKALMTILFFAGIILIATIPIGVLARSKMSMLIYATICGALNLIWGTMIIIHTFSYQFPIGAIILSIFVCLLYLAIGYAGAFWGRFLRSKLFREKAELESDINIQEPVPTEAFEV
ncbi:MAG: hypothetical protein ACTSXA_06680 [Candidatus Heimdallarchaeota archaeon]